MATCSLVRYDNWKVMFMEQRCRGTLQVWAEPFTKLRLPKVFNLRTDPYEFADVTSNTYYEWFIYHDYILYGAYAIADKWAATFKEFPPVQKPNSFTIDDALKMISAATVGEIETKTHLGRRAVARLPRWFVVRRRLKRQSIV